MRQWKEDASASIQLRNNLLSNREKPGLDLIAAVKVLHELTPQQLSRLIRDSGSSIIHHIAEDGSRIEVDVEKFARHLPLHIISVIMAWERDKSTFKYLLCGILLLHAMCDIATRVPKIEQILLDDVKVSEQLVDVVFYLLVTLGAYSQEYLQSPNDIVLLHSALVACGLKLLSVIVSPNYQEIAQVLTAYYKVDTFMDAAFAAVCINVKVLQAKLSAEKAEMSAITSPTDEETLVHLCQQCECSLHFLQSLCEQKIFRERIVKNKELCGNGGVVLLVQAVMDLKLSPLYSASSSYMSAVSRLKSKALAILKYLCEAESISYLDEVASSHRSQELAKSIALQVIELLKKIYVASSSQLAASSEMIQLRGQLELNAMRLADVFSDDSNFRSFIMIQFTEVLAAIFLVPHGKFVSGWCSSNLLVPEDNATLDIPWESYAHHITSLLIKVIANLHCFVPDVCQDEKDVFLNKFVRFLQKDSSDGLLSAIDAEKAKTVRKNICSLLSHAESLVPRFVNDDDLQLIRSFNSQFESMVASVATEDHPDQSSPKASVDQDNVDSKMEESMPKNLPFQEVDLLRGNNITNIQSFDGKTTRKQGKTSGPTEHVTETARDYRTVEASGSDSSPTRVKGDQMNALHFKGSGYDEHMEEEKLDNIQSDEKQQKKRKRPMMNDKQIATIEAAVVDEPNMHRNSSSLKIWADKLSLMGTEVTPSRLKNWLNNRKAKLARVASRKVSVEGETHIDRQGSSGQLDLPNPPTADATVPFPKTGITIPPADATVLFPKTGITIPPADATVPFPKTGITIPPADATVPFPKTGITIETTDTTTQQACGNKELGTSLAPPSRSYVQSGPFLEPGKHVTLVSEKGDEIGKGKVFQVIGDWCGKSLEQSRVCVVDVFELSVDRSTKLMHPLDFTGNSFDQAEKRLGLMRVMWDLNKVFQMPQP